MIVAIAGPIGSGKSTLAGAIADRLGASHVKFGDFVRHRAHERGLDSTDRQVLQDLGRAQVEDDPASFLEATLAWANHQPDKVLVLDGLRHIAVLQALQDRREAREELIQLVFLGLDYEERVRRVAYRGMSPETLARADAHPAESDLVRRLPEVADLVLDGHQAASQLLEAVLARLPRK